METNTPSYESLRDSDGTTSRGTFMQLLKSDFTLNGGNYLKIAIAILGCFLALDVIVSIFTISNINSSTDGPAVINIYDNSVEKTHHDIIRERGMVFIQMGCLFIISIGLSIFGSLTFSSMSSKRKRISTLMLPASTSQKFWLRFLIYSVGGILILSAGVLLSYLIAELAFRGAEYSQLREIIQEIYSKERVGYIIYLAISVGIIWVYTSNSIYALGSAFWPRVSWLKTWVLLCALQWLFGILLICGAFSGMNIGFYFDEMMKDGPETELWILFALLILFNAGCWSLAYWRFRNTQIVQTFMKK